MFQKKKLIIFMSPACPHVTPPKLFYMGHFFQNRHYTPTLHFVYHSKAPDELVYVSYEYSDRL
jgi:hypothetical protein